MNLQGLAAEAIAAVNPPQRATLRVSQGYVTQDDGTRVAKYQTFTGLSFDVQALSQKDLMQLAGLNASQSSHTIYLSGRADAVERVSQRGGDLIEFGGQVWYVTAVLERWADWTKVAVVLQRDR